jgi:hypothetical protein
VTCHVCARTGGLPYHVGGTPYRHQAVLHGLCAGHLEIRAYEAAVERWRAQNPGSPHPCPYHPPYSVSGMVPGQVGP